jgi:hypothetical protein
MRNSDGKWEALEAVSKDIIALSEPYIFGISKWLLYAFMSSSRYSRAFRVDCNSIVKLQLTVHISGSHKLSH